MTISNMSFSTIPKVYANSVVPDSASQRCSVKLQNTKSASRLGKSQRVQKTGRVQTPLLGCM